MGKPRNLNNVVGWERPTVPAMGEIQEKFWNDPKYEHLRKRFEKIRNMGKLDIFTTIVHMSHKIADNERQRVVNSGAAKELHIEKSGMRKASAYNISGMKNKVIINGTNYRVSSFPKWITQAYAYYFTNDNEVILDPFSGHNSRMSAVVESGRKYIGYDVCKGYIDNMQLIYNDMKKRNPEFPDCTLHWESSENIQEADNSVDFIFTSPPFWNAEGYDNDPRQIGGRLSKIGSDVKYNEFLEKYRNIIKQCYRVLKDGHYIGFNVEDMYRNGELYTLSVDTVQAFKDAGFTVTDIVVTPYNSMAKTFLIGKFLWGHFGKTHGYVIFARKGKRLKFDDLAFEELLKEKGVDDDIQDSDDEEN
jgi:DNA modification methylase